MSDSSFAGAMLISQQLSFYRSADRWRDNRAASLLVADYTLIHQQHGELVRRYNALVEDFNKLYRLASESEAERKESASLLKEVTEEKEELARERDTLRLDFANIENRLKLLRTRDRQQNPDLYRFSDD